MIKIEPELTYLGNFSAVEPVHTRYMICFDCQVSWDNFMCTKCCEGELPTFNTNLEMQ